MKFTRLALATIAIAFLVASCKEAVPLDKTTFQVKWEDSVNHTAVSWWYLGENQENYFVAERGPTVEAVYSIGKQAIHINGIELFEFDTGKNPINLKFENVEF